MAYVPKNAKWFLAGVVEEIRVAGSRRNFIHINSVIIRANSPEEAYQRAMVFGKQSEASYENPRGRTVTIRFRGLSRLDVIHDPLGDQCEIMYTERQGVSEKGIRKLLRRKRELEVFLPVRGPSRGRPDYSSGEMVRKVAKLLQAQEKPPNKRLYPTPPRSLRTLRRRG